MLEITQLCKKFNRLPSAFLTTKACRGQPVSVKEGKNGNTQIPDNLAKEFFLWLSKETRQMVMSGKTTAEIVQYIKDLP